MKTKVLLIILMSIAILNMFDGVFTTYWIGIEKAKEANPLMEVLVDYPVAFMIVKTTLVSLGLYLLWLQRKKSFIGVMIGSIIIFVVLSGIIYYHIWGFINI